MTQPTARQQQIKQRQKQLFAANVRREVALEGRPVTRALQRLQPWMAANPYPTKVAA